MRLVALFMLVSSLAIAHHAYAQTSPQPIGDTASASASLATLESAEAEMFRIMAAGDTSGFERIASSDYHTINADGTWLDRAGAKAMLGKFAGVETSFAEQQRHIYGTLGIITGQATYSLHGATVAKIYYTQLWQWKDERWQFLHWQGTMTGAPTWYPVCLTAFGMLLIVGVWRLLRRWRSGPSALVQPAV
jgi:hypothetical protein